MSQAQDDGRAATLQSERWRERLDPQWVARIVAMLRTPILTRGVDGKWR